MATIRDVAKAAGVSTATVSAVLNDSSYVSPALRARVERAVRELDYRPSRAAQVLRRGRSELIAISVADLANPFYAQVVRAAEAAASAASYALIVFNSDERVDAERRILARTQALGCDGMLLIPVGASGDYDRAALAAHPPKVLLGRSLAGQPLDTVTIDNVAAGRQATDYLLDLGHRRIGAIAGRLTTSTGRDRLQGMRDAMAARRIEPDPRHIRVGEFREELAYSLALDMLAATDRPTALYVANGVMAIGVMRAIADLGLDCPADVSIASTDTVTGHGGISPRLTRTEHPIVEMTTEAMRLLVDRIERHTDPAPRCLIFAPSLVVGKSCIPMPSGA